MEDRDARYITGCRHMTDTAARYMEDRAITYMKGTAGYA
jgi:hypothetical protein